MSGAGGPDGDLARLLRIEPGAGGATASLASYFGQAQTFDLLGRAVLAAAERAGELALAELHAEFLRPAPCGVPLELAVETLDSRGDWSLQRVRVTRGEPLAEVTLRFASFGAGPEHSPVFPDGVAKPEDLPSTHEVARREGWETYAAGPIEFRRVNPVWPPPPAEMLDPHREWLRPRVALGADRRLHAAALAFASHFYPHWEFAWRIGTGFSHDRFLVLTHSLTVHEPARFDDWLLLDAESDVARHGRAQSRRRLFARSGRLVASAVTTAAVAEAD
jgi:acyl-CoA thioesterase-2